MLKTHNQNFSMPLPRLSRPYRLLIFSTICLLLIVTYFYAPLLEEEWILYRLSTLNSKGPIITSGGIEHMPFPANFKGRQLAFHQVFESRKVAFSGYKYTQGSRQKQGEKQKVILLWTPWNGVWNTINFYFFRPDDATFKQYGCPNTNCRVTLDKDDIVNADAVLFHLLDLPPEYPKYRHPKQTWIGYIMEAPWQVDKNLTEVNGLMNWTMSYRDDSDVVVKYGFVGKRFVNSLNPSPPPSKSMKKVAFKEKRSVAWFVSDCKTDSRREDYAHELAKHIDVDIYGSCGNNKCFPSQSSVCYEDVLASYKFYLSFENSICLDYATEKFFNVLEYDAIPVTFGGANYTEIAPQGGFINAMEYPDPKDLAKLLREIASDENKHSTYLEWKKNYQAYLHPWMCYLCDKLNGPIEYSLKKDIYSWWMRDAGCRRWTKDEGFVNLKY